ncbi:MAG: adenylate/guanylate cyclase domain-containing protein [Solirubrobacteraceae bacterium]
MWALLQRRWESLITHPWLVGDPTLPGREVGRRVRLTTIAAVALANAVGAVVVLLFSFWALPKPPGVVDGTVNFDNLAAAAIYVPLALALGVLWGRRRLEEGPHGLRGWLFEERAPDPAERSLALRGPLLVMEAQAALWGLGVVLFVALNAGFSWLLGFGVGMTVALGGLTTSAAAYLLSEMSLRPVVSRALASHAPEQRGAPGVTARLLLAWLLGTGVPMVGLLLVAVVALSPVTIHKETLIVTTIALCAIALVFGALVSLMATYLTLHPIGAIRRALARVRQGDLTADMQVWDATEIGLLQAGFNEMVAGLRERERIRDLFGRQVGEEVARRALSEGVQLGGEVRDVAVLFVDLAGSTELAASRPPEDVVAILNRFLAEVVDVITAHGGWIDKFPGDAALAVFGAPLAIDRPQRSALRAARELQARLRERVPDVDAGIGVASGPVVAGHVGTERRFEYTVIGDPVNEAARLTDIAKRHDSRILAAGEMLAGAGEDEAAFWRLGEERVLRGRPVPTRLAWPIGTWG